jgi:UDP-N-acetylglucosamine 2-epimerase (non-hydrolysing)
MNKKKPITKDFCLIFNVSINHLMHVNLLAKNIQSVIVMRINQQSAMEKKMKYNHPIVIVIGTRPEGIKMAPVYLALKQAGIPVVLCSTMQHDQLLTDALNLFNIRPDYELDIMRHGQDLFYVTQSILQKTKEVLKLIQPSLVLVQGDTTTAMATALASFYLHIPVGHIEAGLRTDDIQSPFPEEMNRRVINVIASYHFTPTQTALNNVITHGANPTQTFCTGNTVVDALRIIKEALAVGTLIPRSDIHTQIQLCKKAKQKILLLTMHRRESFAGGVTVTLQTIKKLLLANPDLFCFYPYHPNPQVIHAINAVELSDIKNLFVCEPLTYKDLVYLMDNADVILTDSGGIQEEGVSLGKSVLILREKTERMEGVLTGLAHIVGTNPTTIEVTLKNVLSNIHTSACYSQAIYGDGYAAEKIATILKPLFTQIPTQESVCSEQKYTPTLVDKAIKREDIVTLMTEKKESSNKKDETMKTVCVIGLGYIGLPTAIVIAEHGWPVTGVDINHEKVKAINTGDPVIYEPEIYEKLQIVLGNNLFYATTTASESDYFIIAVPTPITEEKTADLSYVYSAIDSIAFVLKKGNTIIIESTVPVGTTKQIANLLEEKTKLRAGEDFYIAHSPERVLPGKIFYEIIHNDRVIGGINTASLEKAKDLYAQFVQGELYLTDTDSAEMVKLIENSSRDVEIAFAHQVASIASAQGLNPYKIIELANKHPRVNILQPTCGVGGHCLAVDPWFLVETFPEQTTLLRTAREVNDAKRDEVIVQILECVDEWKKQHNKPCIVALFGLSYKPNIDDMRESPAIYIARQLLALKDIKTVVCEPHIKQKALPEELQICAVNITQALDQADIIVFLVAHTRFKAIDKKILAQKTVVDACGILYTPQTQQKLLFVPAQNIMDTFLIENENFSLSQHTDTQFKKDEK